MFSFNDEDLIQLERNHESLRDESIDQPVS